MDCTLEQKPLLNAIGRVVDSIGNTNDESVIICKQCRLPIFDQYMLKVSRGAYHEGCLRCCICLVPLLEKCYEKDGQVYCRIHYYKECSPFRCSGCKLGVSPTDMVYKLKSGIVYHVSCHRCYQCGKQLSPGEQIIVDDASQAVACLTHTNSNNNEHDQQLSLDISLASSSSEFASASDESVLSDVQLIPPSYPRELDSPTSLAQYSFDGYTYEFSDEGKFLKRRGPRTTIKQNQLDILNRIFTSTPKPSKHARAKLSLETGLSMRVIQVWFQNRRSKERRLKHLCNYLRHYEQRGLIPPPIAIGQNVSDRILEAEPNSPTSNITLEQLLAFPFENGQDADDEGDPAS